MSQAFYRKWRPQKWDEVIAQEHIIQTLRNAVRAKRTGHAYLLAGPRGTGKTTTARLLAKALNCLDEDPANRPCDACEHCQAINSGRFLDLIEIDAASNTSVDDVRDLREKINFSPSQGEYKVYIIDEVHMLSTAAFNALLKTLEEPPPHAVFILATTEVHKIPATILSRVQRYEFRRIPVSEIVRYLKVKALEEGLEVDEDALTLIARQATGAMRDAVSLLDQLASTGQRVTLAEAQVVLGTATNSLVVEIVAALQARDAARGFHIIQAALDAGADARQFARQIVDYLRSLLLVSLGNANQVDATQEMRQAMAGQAAAIEMADLLEYIRLFNSAATDSRSSWHPGLALELAVAEAVEGPAQPPTPPEDSPPRRESHSRRQPPVAPENSPPPGHEPPQAPQARAETTPASPDSPPAAAAAAPAEGLPPRAGRQRARPAPEEQPAEAKATPAGSPPDQAQPRAVTQQEMQHNWQRIRALVRRRNSLTEAALNSCRYMVRDNILVLSFSSEVVKLKMDTEENINLLREALQSVLGLSLPVRCVLSGSKSAQPGGLEEDVDGDGMVGTALDLGGKIVYDE